MLIWEMVSGLYPACKFVSWSFWSPGYTGLLLPRFSQPSTCLLSGVFHVLLWPLETFEFCDLFQGGGMEGIVLNYQYGHLGCGGAFGE